MKQILQTLAVLLSVAVAAPVAALGLGQLQHDSALNERLDARIPLLSATADELATLRVSLANQEAFSRANINYVPALSLLRFELVDSQNASAYIHVTSVEPIREPFLNFLVELSWREGRIYREYTVLLDPPLYDPTYDRVAASPPPPSATEQPGSQYSHSVDYSDQQRVKAVYRPSYGGGDYGPVQAGETLWAIADRMRPADVTTQQMMLALLRTNPGAFINNNINGLKRGVILRLPNEPEMNALGASQALAEVSNQHALWEQLRQSVAASPAPRGASAGAPADVESASDSEEATSESRLELVAATDGDTDQQSGNPTGAELKQKLALANEQIESLRQEKTDLEDQLAANTALIEDLKRLMTLKSDQLAQIQNQDLQAAAETDAAATTAPVELSHTVNYPNGDPAQFINQEPGPEGVAPAPATTAPVELSHTVNYPNGDPAQFINQEIDSTGVAPVSTESTAEPTTAIAQPQVEPQTTAPAAEPSPTTAAPTGGDILDFLADLAGTVRDFIMVNLMAVAGVLLGLIVLLAGMNAAGRRREAAADREAEAQLESSGFPSIGGETGAVATAQDEDDVPTEESKLSAAGNDDFLGIEPKGKATAETSAAEEEAEPLAEVNVLMAYEHFDQAESFVRNALKSDPDNVDYQSKLLEVFYAAGNKKKYEQAASQLRDLTGAQGEHWDMAVAMWQEMSPNRPLFEGADDEADEPLAPGTSGGGIVDITSDTVAGATAGGIDFDLGGASTQPGEAANAGRIDEMLDLTASQGTANAGMLDLTTASQQDESADKMLDSTAPNDSMSALDQGNARTLAQTEVADDNSLDFTLDGVDAAQTTPADSVTDLDFTLDDIDSELAAPVESGVTSDADNMLGFDSTDAEFGARDADPGDPGQVGSGINFDNLDLQIESYDDSTDLEEIGDELDRLEQTLGTLSQQELSQYDPTSDAPDDIDSALDSPGESDGQGRDGAQSVTNTATELPIDTDDGGLDFNLDTDDITLDTLPIDAVDFNKDSTDHGFDLTLDSDTGSGDESLNTIEMDSTVELPKHLGDDTGLSLEEMTDDDDAGEETPFLTRGGNIDEQSLEDELTTKLDLAKAYVELGDSNSARGILDEVLRDGNNDQKRQAGELLQQL